MNLLLFASIFLVVMAGANFYIYRRFLRKLSAIPPRVSVFIPILLMAGEIFFVLDIALGVIPDSPTLYFVTSAFVGFTFMLFVIATLYDLIITVSRRVPVDQERRRFIKLVFDITMFVAAMSYLLRGLSQGLKFPELNQVQIQLKDFPVQRYRIVQLTDIHVGRTVKQDFIESLVAATNQLNPDMVVITGDLVDLPIERIKNALAPLQQIRAPVYFILGNHEYFHGPYAALDYLRELGIRPLLNESLTISTKNGPFNLVGITDLVGERLGMLPPDFAAAFANLDTTKATIVLAHQPKSILRVDPYRCDLMLSGHTHGGQIFPFGLLVMVDQPYLAGLHRHGVNKQIFVSRGTGYWGPPLRVLAPSEFTLLEISAAN